MSPVYHYTRLRAWRAMERSGSIEPRTHLLQPHWRNVPRDAHRRHLFLLPEPEPRGWKESRRLDTLLAYILRDLEGKQACDWRSHVALIALDLRPEDDAHVVAFDHFDELDERAARDRSVPKMIHQARAVRAYYASRVPLASYDGSYRLPEIIVPHPVPVSRAQLVWEKHAGELLFGGAFSRHRAR